MALVVQCFLTWPLNENFSQKRSERAREKLILSFCPRIKDSFHFCSLSPASPLRRSRKGEPALTSSSCSNTTVPGPFARTNKVEAMDGIQEASKVERIEVLNKEGQRLVGVLAEGQSREISVLCHGFRSTKNSSTLRSIGDALNGRGISTLKFDFRGNGQSEGDFCYGNYSHEVEDLRSVIEFLRSNGWEVTNIIGHSKGGNAVLLYASKYADVSSVVNVSGRCVMENGITERLGVEGRDAVMRDGFYDVRSPTTGAIEYRVTRASLEERLATDMASAVSRIPKTCRVLTVHGDNDDTVPVEDAHRFEKLVPNHQLSIIEGADHGFREHRQELAKEVLNFLCASGLKA